MKIDFKMKNGFHYGVNVENLLAYLSECDLSDITEGEFEVEGETPSGCSGYATVDVTLLADDALDLIKELRKGLKDLADIFEHTSTDYCMCGSAIEEHVIGGGCGNPTSQQDYHFGEWKRLNSDLLEED